MGIVGYEINFNRYFYQYQPPRPLEAIDADLKPLPTAVGTLKSRGFFVRACSLSKRATCANLSITTPAKAMLLGVSSNRRVTFLGG